MGNNKMRVGVIAVLLVAGVAGFGLLRKDATTGVVKPAQQNLQMSPAAAKPVAYDGIDGRHALELLRQGHKIETASYAGMGEVVKNIDGAAADADHYWALYVNGQVSGVSPDMYTTKATDKIEWKLEAIQN